MSGNRIAYHVLWTLIGVGVVVKAWATPSVWPFIVLYSMGVSLILFSTSMLWFGGPQRKAPRADYRPKHRTS